MIRFIYVEKRIKDLDYTAEIISKFPGAETIEIENAREILKRPKQNFSAQKACQQLILAANDASFICAASDNCQDMGADEFYYCSLLKNCIYSCDYCYLQGTYKCGHLVAYVNLDDCFAAVRDLMREKSGNIFLPISYESDILALEEAFGYVGKWADFLENNDYDNLTVEVRTKCGSVSLLRKLPKNMVTTWSLNPDSVIKRFEKCASPLEERLKAIGKALEIGNRVRIAIDPIIASCDVEKAEYEELVGRISGLGILEKIEAVSVGCFRVPANFLKIMRKNAPDSPLSWDNYYFDGKTATYSPEICKIYVNSIKNRLVMYGFDENKIYIHE